jgi:fructokinase
MDIVALGELLIDFTDAGDADKGARLFERNAGGAPANVAVWANTLGLKTAFIGKVGDDAHGTFLRHALEARSVDCRNLCVDADAATTLAFVELSQGGEREFSFVRKGAADTRLCVDDLDMTLIGGTKVLHLGTLSLTDEPARSATLFAAQYAKEHGVTVSLDVNYRALLWESAEEFRRRTYELLPFVSLLKVSEDEAYLLGPAIYSCGTVVITRGERGATICENTYVAKIEGDSQIPLVGSSTQVAAAPVERVVDTTGAGDAFFAGFLFEYLRREQFAGLTGEAAAKLAAKCVQRRGAWPQ